MNRQEVNVSTSICRADSGTTLSKPFLGVLVGLLFFLLVLACPVWIYERQTQFCLADAKLREAKYLLGVHYRTDDVRSTPVSAYLSSVPLPIAERRWVVVRRRGVLFPMDLFKWYHHESFRYGTVFFDISCLEAIWTRRADMSVEENKDMACRYMAYLRNNDPDGATRWVGSMFEKELRRSDVEKEYDAP